jgi:hypothetical protein
MLCAQQTIAFSHLAKRRIDSKFQTQIETAAVVRLHTLEALSVVAQHANERPWEHLEWFTTVKEGTLVRLIVECAEEHVHTQVCPRRRMLAWRAFACSFSMFLPFFMCLLSWIKTYACRFEYDRERTCMCQVLCIEFTP